MLIKMDKQELVSFIQQQPNDCFVLHLLRFVLVFWVFSRLIVRSPLSALYNDAHTGDDINAVMRTIPSSFN